MRKSNEPGPADARHDRLDRVATLYAEITAATREFLRALAAVDRNGDFREEGFDTCAEWLAWRIGVTRNTANEKVRAARALEGLPLISEAMARGEISFSKVRALTRVARPESEAELLELARAGSTAHLERVVRGWKLLGRADEQRRERALHRSRSLSVFPDETGMYVVRGRLSPEVAAVLMRAVEAASDALFATGNGLAREEVEPGQRRADAIGLLAERALAAGFGGRGDAERSEGRSEGRPKGRSAGSNDRAGVGRSPRWSADRYQVVLHVDESTLSEGGEPGLSELEDGSRVSAETARRISCDARRVIAGTDGVGRVLGVGRRTRTIPPSLRRALEARDRGCRFPGCSCRFTDAHHVRHWADGGLTTLDNTVLLCRRHHRRVHEDGWRVCSDRDGQIVFFRPDGTALAGAPPMPRREGDATERLFESNRARGVRPDWRTGRPTWRHDRDVPWRVEAVAWEALDRAEAEGPAPTRASDAAATDPPDTAAAA